MDSNTERGPSIWIATQRGPSVNTSLSKGVVKSWAGGDGGLRLVIIFTETSLQNTPPPLCYISGFLIGWPGLLKYERGAWWLLLRAVSLTTACALLTK